MDGTGCSLSECPQLFLLELFDCYAAHAKLLLWILMKNVIVVIADLMLLQGKLNDYIIHVMIDVIFNIELNESEYKYGFHDYNDNSQKQ